jgi:hypothetical protein|mmetsp:Transcript_60322/g.99679  ORF Transcript_60322/g.99679 Transcript_60322/m.99679 type:complete len:85 (-) Transcript_60322:202-456(-)
MSQGSQLPPAVAATTVPNRSKDPLPGLLPKYVLPHQTFCAAQNKNPAPKSQAPSGVQPHLVWDVALVALGMMFSTVQFELAQAF